jgi:hypothetical protein
MPALPDVPGVIKFELLWTQAGIPCANVIHASFTGGTPTAENLIAFASDVAGSLWQVGLYSGYPTSTVLVGVKATDLTTSSSAVGEYASGVAGTFEGGELPAQAAVLVNYQITRRYRGGHPRLYMVPPNSELLAGPSEWDSTILTELGARMTAVLSTLSSDVQDSIDLTGQVCVSYRDGDAPRVDPLVEPITGLVVSPIMATQRRRIRASSY